jgi:hypothetical protein
VTPIADWGLRPVIRSVVVPRHRRADAVHRGRYYEHRWPKHAHRDVFEQPGRWAAGGWSLVGAVGLATFIVALLIGSDSAVVGWANLSLVTASFCGHASNAALSRRRRSVLLAPVLAAAAIVGALVCVGIVAIAWDVLLVATIACWVPIAVADIAAPAGTYLVRASN